MKTVTVLLGLGVVGLGVLGAVTLSKKKAEAQPPPPPAPGIIPPGVLPPGILPTPAPAAPAAPSGGGGLVFATDASTIHLRQGQYYRGRLNMGSGGLAGLLPFTGAATEEDIGKGLAALGLQDVRVYMNVSNLPSDWPRETAQNTEAGTRWFQGQWSGITATVPKPAQVEAVWVTASPELVAARALQAATTSGLGAVMSG
jgi:hypothetical protein